MSSNDKFTPQEFSEDDLKTWDLPFMEDTVKDHSKTNALNRTSEWKYEPPEEVEEIRPPTAEEIEAIRQQAYEAGFEEGKAEGFEKGLEEGREQGHQQGHETGFNQGHEEGLATGTEAVNAQLAQWQALTEKLLKPVAQVDKQLEQELVLLATSLARAVIRTEVKTNEDIIFQALSEGLKVLPIGEKAYQIHMHPDDIALIKQHFTEEDIEKHHWQLVESPEMSQGGCDIITNSNAVDVSVERRVRDILDKFLLQQGLDYAAGGNTSADTETDNE